MNAQDAVPLSIQAGSAMRREIEHRLGLLPHALEVVPLRATAAGAPATASAAASMRGGRVQLLPAGEFAARDGRPGPGKKWRLTDSGGAALAARANAIAQRTPISIDYEHQTLLAVTNGRPAPAAGWITSLSWTTGVGLFGAVQWTAAAARQIDAGEYRYISPVITFDGQGNVTELVNAALTNFPALIGMAPAVAALAAPVSFAPPVALRAGFVTAGASQADEEHRTHMERVFGMTLEDLRAAAPTKR